MKRIIIITLALVAIALAGNAGLKRQEMAECAAWRALARENKLFYFTKWQAMQCGINKIAQK